MHPTTFLQLCQRTARECGISGTGPTSVVSQTGEAGRIVDWVRTSYYDLQTLHTDWDWLWAEDTLTLVAGTGEYTEPFATNNARALDGHVYLQTGANENRDKLVRYDYPLFRDRVLMKARLTGKPFRYAVKPNESALLVDPLPDSAATYTLSYAYWRDTHTLSADADTVLIPDKHTMVIVWGAVMKFAQYEEAGALMQTAQYHYNEALRMLRESHLRRRVFCWRPIA